MAMSDLSGKRDLLRHALATLAYRGGKALRDAPEGFATFRAGESTRAPGEILAHLGDLFDWAHHLLKGELVWREAPAGTWEEGTARFFDGLARLDAFLASETPLGCPPEQVFQGPIADAFTHVGQLAMLRRLAGAPVRSEYFFKADIAAGRIGPEQSPPHGEFD
jgi:hypothetical protein